MRCWKMFSQAAAIGLTAASVACSRDKSPIDAAGAVSVPGVTAAGADKSPCPATGQWAECSVEQRMKRAGLVARRIEGSSAPRAAFSVRPAAYALGRDSRLEIFLYPSRAALARDIEKMDTIKVAPRGGAEAWSTPPVLIRSVNLAAVLLTHDAREADRLYLALTAGPPGAR
jgi:hypothetical protein